MTTIIAIFFDFIQKVAQVTFWIGLVIGISMIVTALFCLFSYLSAARQGLLDCSTDPWDEDDGDPLDKDYENS